MVVTTSWYLALGAVLFSIGAVGLLTRRNPLVMFMCVELMLNAVNLTFVSLGAELGDLGGLRACRRGGRGRGRPRDNRGHHAPPPGCDGR